MRLYSIVLLLIAFPAIASEDDVELFNEAYRAHSVATKEGDTELAISSGKAALEIGSGILDAGDPKIATLMYNYGNALVQGGRLELGKQLLLQAIDARIESTNKYDPELVEYYVNLAVASAGFGNQSQQLKWLKRALNTSARNHGAESIEYATLAYLVGTSVYEGSQSPLGEKYLKQALKIYEKESGADSKAAGMANYQLGRIAFYRRHYREVTKYQLAALNAFGGDDVDDQAQRLMIHARLVEAYESLGQSEKATQHCVAIGKESRIAPDQDYVPLFRILPQYPRSHWRNGVEGFVKLSFTIDENGFVKNPEVVDALTGPRSGGGKFESGFRDPQEHRSFEAAALAALERYRYAPRFVDGVAVPVDDVKIRIDFELVE